MTYDPLSHGSLLSVTYNPPGAPRKKGKHAIPEPLYARDLRIFQWRVQDWFENNIPTNAHAKLKLRHFFENPDVEKLKKTPRFIGGIQVLEGDLSIKYSIMRFVNPDDSYSYSVLSDTMVGLPGAYGRVKLALPLIYDNGNCTATIFLNEPHLVKIMRHNRLDEMERYPDQTFPTRAGVTAMRHSYGSSFAFTKCLTMSTKSRYVVPPNASPEERDSIAKSIQLELASSIKRYFKIPLFAGSDLFEFISERCTKGIRLTEAAVLKIIGGILTEVKKLHSLGIVHRDIKPENMMIDANLVVKLIDLDGCAFEGSCVPFAGTPEYFSEAHVRRYCSDNAETVNKQRDLFAVGKTISDILQIAEPTLYLQDTVLGLAMCMTSGNYPDIQAVEQDFVSRFPTMMTNTDESVGEGGPTRVVSVSFR